MNRIGANERQGGSAYIATLLAMVVLTIIGLSLALITQSEMQVGANERIIQRVFYSADSGFAASTVRAMVSNDYSEQSLTMDENPSALIKPKSIVSLSPMVPILDAPCNLCEINNAGTYGETAYRRVSHAIMTTANRVGGDTETQIGEKTLGAMIDFQPWKDPPQAFLPLQDEEQLAAIKF